MANEVPNIYMNPTPPAEKKPFGCFKMIAIGCGVMALFALVVVIMFVNAVSWVGNAASKTPATYPPLTLSEGENEDINRVIMSIDGAKKNGGEVDEYVTPQVFNGIFEKVIAEELRKDPKKDGPTTIRLALADGNAVRLQLTAPARDEQNNLNYVNVDTVFDLEIQDGQLKKADIKSLKLDGKEPPVMARMFMNWMSSMIKDASAKQTSNVDNELKVFKLVKREGDRIHFTLDGKEMAEQEKRKQERAAEPVKKNEGPRPNQPETPKPSQD